MNFRKKFSYLLDNIQPQIMILFISFATLLLTVLLTIYNYRINKNVLYLSGFLTPIAISGILHYFFLLDNSAWNLAVVYGHFMPLYYLAGPMLYFYVRGTLRDSYKIYSWDYLHLLPFLISLVSIFPYYFEDFDTKIKIAESIIGDPNYHRKINISWMYNNIYNLVLRPIFLFFYFLISLTLIVRYSIQKKKVELENSQKSIITKWLYSITFLAGICSLSYFIITLHYFDGDFLNRNHVNSLGLNYIIGIAFTLIPVTMILFPHVIYGLPKITMRESLIATQGRTLDVSKDQKLTRKLETVNKENFQRLTEKIMDYLKAEKPFTDPNYSLEDLANHFDLQKHHLYYCFNTILNSRFSTIKTQLRVEYAMECLLNGDLDILSMEGVWTKTGFSSRTSFFVSFKEITGKTPLDFIKPAKKEPAKKKE
jgi:AraC-like DNA-binding protein